LFGQTFYWQILRKYVVLFGYLFNDIYINRVDSSNNEVQTMKVPLSYGPREKFLARALGDPDLKRKIAMALPRMSFEIGGITYDSERKLQTTGKTYSVANNANSLSFVYNPVPYNIQFSLYVMVRNADDGTRILEQILPWFAPEFTQTVILIPDLGIKQDIPIVLDSVTSIDTYESNFEERRALIWTLNFTMKGYLYGPLHDTGSIIKQVILNFGTSDDPQLAPSAGNSGILETITITPGLTANGQPTSNSSQSIPYEEISANTDYGYITDFMSDFATSNT
jgi:hypothetical protein